MRQALLMKLELPIDSECMLGYAGALAFLKWLEIVQLDNELSLNSPINQDLGHMLTEALPPFQQQLPVERYYLWHHYVKISMIGQRSGQET